jgi:hypothetical protein
MPSIFEFDETISITTFADYCLDDANPLESQYYRGKKIGQTSRKNGAEHYFKHDENELCGITTLQNNPAFVAGNIAAYLNKELIFVGTTTSQTTPNIAVNQYNVQGLDKPIFICFVPHKGDEYQTALSTLRDNKNQQIDLLRKVWIENKLIKRTSYINFYDESFMACSATQNLHYINAFEVMGKESNFKFSGQYLAAAAKPAHSNIEQFDDYLEKLIKKVQTLKKDGHTQAALAADTLYNTLSNQFDDFYYGTLPLVDFQEKCCEAIDLAHVELDTHRGWKELLENIALFICTLGVGLLVKGIYNACTNKPFLFFAKTNSAQLLDDTEECLNSITAPGYAAV